MKRSSAFPWSPRGHQHVALCVDAPSQDAIRNGAEAAGIETRLADHGYCQSLYLTDPNGLKLELTVDHPEVEAIDVIRTRSAHEDLARWLAGDHSTNNDWRREAELPESGPSVREGRTRSPRIVADT